MSEIHFNQPRLSPNVRRILIALVAIFLIDGLLQAFLKIHVSGILGFSPKLFFENFFLWQIFTYPFLHGSLTHLLFNGLVLYSLGSQLEFRWGSKKFLKYFFLCSTGGAFLQSLIWGVSKVFFESMSDSLGRIPIIGASGGLYGLFVAFGLLYAESRVHVFLIFPMKAKHFVMLLTGIEVVSAVLYSESGVAHLVHLGGLFTGYFWLKFKGPNLDGRGGGFGGKRKTMDHDEVRRRLKLIVNRDEISNTNEGGKYPPTWN